MAPRWGIGLSIALVMLAFAGNSVITRYLVLGDLASPFMLTTVRFGSGFAMLLLIWAASPGAFFPRFRGRPDLIGGSLLGAYAFSISYGYLFISAAAGTLVFYAFVVLTMALAGYLSDGDRPTQRTVAGQALALFGVVVITFGGIRDVTPSGVLLMAVTGASWGLYSVHGRTAPDAAAYTFATFLVVALFSLSVAPFLAFLDPRFVRIKPSWNGLGIALFMGMISTALSYILWHKTLRRIKASQGGIVQLTVPVLASAMGILLLGEDLTAALVLGGAAVLVGIYLNRVDSG